MESHLTSIGERLKTLRAARGWSLDRVAGSTGVSKAMLGQIERGESTPTVATLWKIASGMRTPLSHFLLSTTVRTASPSQVEHRDASGMTVVPLFAFDPALGFEMYVIDLAPGAASESTPHAPGVIEHVIVIEGALELRVEGQRYVLRPGEAVRFAADQAHAYRNAGKVRARFHDLIHYPLDMSAPI